MLSLVTAACVAPRVQGNLTYNHVTPKLLHLHLGGACFTKQGSWVRALKHHMLGQRPHP